MLQKLFTFDFFFYLTLMFIFSAIFSFVFLRKPCKACENATKQSCTNYGYLRGPQETGGEKVL